MRKSLCLLVLAQVVGWCQLTRSSPPFSYIDTAANIVAKACRVGQAPSFATDATAGSNLYLCTSTNVWTNVSGASSGGTVTNTGGNLTADLPMFGAGGADSKVGTKTGTGNVAVMQASPSITTPTITDFTNATHTHANAAGGGALPPTSVTGIRSGLTANKPGTCTTGDLYFATDATAGQNIYECSATNVWTQQLDTASSAGGVIAYSGPALATVSGTIYCPVGGGGACSATESNVDLASSSQATITNLTAQLSAAVGAGNSVAITWRKAGVDQSSTCTISGASQTECQDSAHSFNVSQGDLLALKLVFSGTIVVNPFLATMSQFGTSQSGGTVNSGMSGQLGYYSATGTAMSGNANATISNGALTLGQASSVLGSLGVSGNTSGVVTVKPQAAAGTYNFNLPTTAGTSGQPLLSAGGGSSPMTFGTLGVAAGGTNLTSGTSGGVLGFTASGTLASSTALTANGVVIGGGAGATPTSIAADTTTTDALFATAGAPAFRAITFSDLPASANLLDTTVVSFNEEFPPGSVTSLQVGTYGWTIRAIGAAGGLNFIGSASPNLGIIKVPTTTTSGQGTILALDNGNVTPLANLSTSNPWDSYWIFEFVTQSSVQSRIGYSACCQSTAIPTAGYYIRFDDQLKSFTSANCNDGTNKCGLTALTCATNDTVTGTINGGTGTFSVACTGTNAIANGTALTISAAGAGYNSTATYTAGLATGGTASVHTGSIAFNTVVLGAAASGPDTHFMACVDVSSLESCVDTGITIDATFHKARFRQVVSGTIGITFYNNAGAVQMAEKTFCPSACDVTATPNASNQTPTIIEATATTAAATIYADAWKFVATGLAR